MSHLVRPILVCTTIVLLGVAVYISIALFQVIDGQQGVAADLHYYRFVAQRWLDSGVFYTDRQLVGPYQVQTEVDNLYPPQALFLFVPFLVLPAILWWLIPLGLITYVVWWCRPVTWAWPIIALIILFPKTPNQIIYGNTDMWITAAIAAGVRWSWPAVLVALKPSLGFFGLIGIRSRSWWIAAIVLVVVSLPFIGLLLQYPTAMRNSSANVLYSFGNLPFFVLPIVAWLTSTRRGQLPMRTWVGRLFGGRAAAA